MLGERIRNIRQKLPILLALTDGFLYCRESGNTAEEVTVAGFECDCHVLQW